MLQAKNISLQESLASVHTVKHFYERQRSDDAFDSFFDKIVEEARSLNIGEPKLPRPPKNLKDLYPISLTHQNHFLDKCSLSHVTFSLMNWSQDSNNRLLNLCW